MGFYCAERVVAKTKQIINSCCWGPRCFISFCIQLQCPISFLLFVILEVIRHFSVRETERNYLS